MKKTSLHSRHIEKAAKMVNFANYEMPISYKGIVTEHLAVRKSAGLFDVSHMGEFFVSGKLAASFLQKLSTNDINRLEGGKAQYSCLCNENGRVLDDLIVYCIDKQSFMVVVNASNRQKIWDWMQAHKMDGVSLEDRSERLSLLALQGPKANEILAPICDLAVADISYYQFEYGTVAGQPEVLVSATGYTGSGGFELYCHSDAAPVIWDAILESGAAHGIEPAGLGCRDSLRLEKCYALYGHELGEKISPLEAGLGWITRFSTDFIGKEALLQQKKEGLKRHLVAFKVLDRGIPRQNYLLLNESGEEVGQVTSGTHSPSLGYGIGMAFVQSGFEKVGTELGLAVRKKVLRAEVVKKPFL